MAGRSSRGLQHPGYDMKEPGAAGKSATSSLILALSDGEDEVQRPAAAHVRACRAQVRQQGLLVAAAFLEGVAEDEKPGRLERAVGPPLLVGGLGERENGRAEAGAAGRGDGAEWIADDLAEQGDEYGLPTPAVTGHVGGQV